MPNILDITNTPAYPDKYPGPGFSYQFARGTVRTDRNVQPGNSAQQTTGLAALSLASNLGIPQVAQIGQSVISQGNYDVASQYNAVPFTNLNRFPGVEYQDFRSRKGFDSVDLISKRLDGAAAATRRGQLKNRWIAAAYAAASASPVGAYSVFNLNAPGPFGRGIGDHGNIYALRNDFTAQSHVATKWDRRNNSGWIPVTNPISIATPFRGDRVQVIDFGQRSLNNVYQWNPISEGILGASILTQTQDFIKFYFTGPSLSPARKGDTTNPEDDIIVFRALLTGVTDSYNPQWSPVSYIGRADPSYQYTAYNRGVTLSFDVYASDRDEMKPIWRKLNAMAGYTAPTYDTDSIALEGPWMRFTLGDLFYQQPAVMTSLQYTLVDADTLWEINVEKDATMMEVPFKVSVTMQLNIITNELPQKGGRFYTLAKRFNNDTSEPLTGDDNWLSDSFNNIDAEPTQRELDRADRRFERKTERENNKYLRKKNREYKKGLRRGEFQPRSRF